MSAQNGDQTVTWNGQEYDEETFASAARIAVNSVSASNAGSIHTRDDYLNRLGRQYSGDREIFDVLGYPDEIELDDYRAKYERDIGKRLVRLPAEDSWQTPPKITDDEAAEETTDFEEALANFEQAVKPWHFLRRTDIVAGIGQYGVLFIGFTDGGDLNEEVSVDSLPSNPTEAVSHFEVFAHDSVDEWRLGKDNGLEPSDERYNKPIQYKLDFGDPDDESTEDPEWVHWTRVLHVPSDERDESNILGTPRLQDVYNRLIDLEKTVGASAEIFWTGAAPRYQFNVESDNAADIPQDELDALDDEVMKLVHDMQNYIKTFNTDLEVISGEEVDPSGVVDTILTGIAGTKGIPKRILMGSERGELASTQDRATWYSRVGERRNQFVEPTQVRPFIDRLIAFDVLPDPLNGIYDVIWPNLFELNEVEKSEVQANRAEVIANLAPGGNTDLLAPFSELMNYVINGEMPDFSDAADPTPLNEDNPEVQRQFGRLTEGESE